MIVIGLTGGIAMGKSEVAKILASDGIPVFDSDLEVHRLYDSGDGGKLIADIAPAAISNGKVDRHQLASIVVAQPALLGELEKRVHAEIRRRRLGFIAEEEAKGTVMVAVDIPLLFETGAERDVTTTVVVSARSELQRERALKRPGMTPEKLALILQRQMPDDEKRRRADHVIETNGSLEELSQRVRDVVHKIRKGNSR